MVMTATEMQVVGDGPLSDELLERLTRIVVSDGGVSSAPVSTQITLNNRRR